MEIIEKRVKVETFLISAICPECGATMKKTNMILTTHPPKYQYYCPHCDFIENSFELYPKIDYIETNV